MGHWWPLIQILTSRNQFWVLFPEIYQISCVVVDEIYQRWLRRTDGQFGQEQPWASYQIRKIAGCACAGKAGNVFLRRRLQRKSLVNDHGMHHGRAMVYAGIAYPRWRGKRSRHSRRMRTRNFTYLERGPCKKLWEFSKIIAYPRWRGKRSRHSRRMRTRNFTYLESGPCKKLWEFSKINGFLLPTCG